MELVEQQVEVEHREELQTEGERTGVAVLVEEPGTVEAGEAGETQGRRMARRFESEHVVVVVVGMASERIAVQFGRLVGAAE